jgi:hypothetical protein
VRLKPLAALAVLATAIAACSVAPESLSSPGPSASPLALLPSATPTGSACPELPTEHPPPDSLPADLDEATRLAIEKRREYGLRRDIPWVRLVAADPRADTAFGFPMLPEEEQSLFSRHDPAEAVQRVLMGYGHEDELGGLYIDNVLGGTVVVLWTGNIEAHAAAIRALLPECHPVIFKRVRWSEAELRRWQDKISADWNWFATIPAAPQGVGASVSDNVVTVDISSANPNAAAIIVAHYGAPPGMIRVQSDGTGAALLPWGTVKGRVVLRNGERPAGPFQLLLFGEAGPDPGTCGGGDIGFGVMPDGTFEYACQVGRREIQIWDLGAGKDPHPIVGRATVLVPEDDVVFVEIVIEPPSQP